VFDAKKGVPMKLLVKFNLVLVLLFAGAIAATATIGWDLVKRNAREEVTYNAKLLIDSASAVRQYTLMRIYPLLLTQAQYEFRPEMVSAFSAIDVLKNLRTANADYKQFVYREPALNPTNLEDRAVDWEADIIGQFRNGTATVPLAGERDTPSGRMIYVAKPLKASAGCLYCHDTADRAPPTMVAIYGPTNGFGWKLDEIVAAQIVQVPVAVAQARAENTFRVFISSMVGVLVGVAAILNGLLWWMFIRPVTRISALADRISLGAMDAPDFSARSRDEIGSLAASLSRMRKSLVQAMKMLEG
jgi:HAMP domain-containing protein